MARRFPLESLRELAQDQTEGSARTLNVLKARWSEAEEKLAALVSYREEYRARLHSDSGRGMNAGALKDFHAFVARIETAIRAQTEEASRHQARWEEGRKHWLAQKHKLSAYDVLADRHHTSEQKREAKIEQHDQDEYAARIHQRQRDEGES